MTDEAATQNAPEAYRGIAAGSGLNQARKTLKIGFPKKRDEGVTSIRITARKDELEFSLPGTAYSTPAMVAAPFSCSIPWLKIKTILDLKHDERALVQLQFAAGWFDIGGMITRSDAILISSGENAPGQAPGDLFGQMDSEDVEAPQNAPTRHVRPADVSMNLPLLEAYFYIKQYGIRPYIGNQQFLKQKTRVDNLLNQAGSQLSHLGLSRNDLERLIDEKFGHLVIGKPE